MAAFKASDFINEAVESVLKQTHSNLELIIVPVLGDDETMKEIEKMKDKRIRIIMSNYARMTHQRNLGIYASCGKYMNLFDSDDFWYKDGINRVLKVAESKKAVVVYPDFYHASKRLRNIRRMYCGDFNYNILLHDGCFITDVSLVLRKVLMKFMPFRFPKGRAAVYDLWKRIASNKKYRSKMLNCAKPTFLYRHSPQSNNSNISNESENFFTCVRYGNNELVQQFQSFIQVIDNLDNLKKFHYCIYFPDPKLCLKEIDKIKFKRILVHWQLKNVDDAKLFEKYKYVYHICHDQDTYASLVSKNLNNVKMFSSPSAFKEFLDNEDYK